MPIQNADIASVLDQIGDLLELDDANPFRVRAYRNAAIEVNRRSADIAALVASGEGVPKIQGVGTDLSAKILEIAQTGRCQYLEELRARYPEGITHLLELPGLGPKRVRLLFDQLKVTSIADLEQAIRDGRLRAVAGFGPKSEEKILAAIAARGGSST